MIEKKTAPDLERFKLFLQEEELATGTVRT